MSKVHTDVAFNRFLEFAPFSSKFFLPNKNCQSHHRIPLISGDLPLELLLQFYLCMPLLQIQAMQPAKCRSNLGSLNIWEKQLAFRSVLEMLAKTRRRICSEHRDFCHVSTDTHCYQPTHPLLDAVARRGPFNTFIFPQYVLLLRILKKKRLRSKSIDNWDSLHVSQYVWISMTFKSSL